MGKGKTPTKEAGKREEETMVSQNPRKDGELLFNGYIVSVRGDEHFGNSSDG